MVTDGGSNQEELSYTGKSHLNFKDDYTERMEGINKNAVLSKFDSHVIEDFIENYKNYEYGFSNLKQIISFRNHTQLVNYKITIK
ncbi:MAG: hypothetical protein U5Q03_00890 [Bacteroidota bacterium]|nr:hypothetical protein [Bacteroidota bacterium]